MFYMSTGYNIQTSYHVCRSKPLDRLLFVVNSVTRATFNGAVSSITLHTDAVRQLLNMHYSFHLRCNYVAAKVKARHFMARSSRSVEIL